jgi:hypothetical protein
MRSTPRASWTFNLLRSKRACTHPHAGLPLDKSGSGQPYHADLGVSAFSFSSASGIIWPNIGGRLTRVVLKNKLMSMNERVLAGSD